MTLKGISSYIMSLFMYDKFIKCNDYDTFDVQPYEISILNNLISQGHLQNDQRILALSLKRNSS